MQCMKQYKLYKNGYSAAVSTTVFVYDVRTDSLGTATNFPLNNFFPLAILREDDLYLIGGETGGSEIDGEYFSHHLDLFLKGRIRPIEGES